MARFLQRFVAEAPPPQDDFWYEPVGLSSETGLRIDEATAITVSTVYACVRVIAETMGSVPLLIYRRRPNGGKDRVDDHPLFDLLHNAPNPYHTAMEFRELMTGIAVLRGKAYAQIVPGPRGFVDQLLPIHPDAVRPRRMRDGSRVYKVRAEDGTSELLRWEELLVIRGPNWADEAGMDIMRDARDSIGVARAAKLYAARFFKNDASPRGYLKTEKSYQKNQDVAKRLLAGWASTYGGVLNAHKTALLEEGMTWEQVGIDAEKAQLLATQEHAVEDICRWFRMQPHKVAHLKNATFSNIEQQSIEHVVDTILPWSVRWEQAISRDLILAPRTYFAEHLLSGLLRGDIQARYDAYAVAVQNGWMTRNEVRRLENMNPAEGLDEFLSPLNMATVGREQGGKP